MRFPGNFWYDRKGKSIKSWKTLTKRLSDPHYRRVAFSVMRNGYWVATSWLGFNHRIVGKGKPLIFETMVFYANTYKGVAQHRYSTEAAAVAGHRAVVREWMKMPKAKRPKDAKLYKIAPPKKRRKKGVTRARVQA